MKFANYHKIYKCDVANGPGVRITIFFSGCIHACPGCYNESTWNPKSGEPLNEEIINELLRDCDDYSGLSFSGGDPMHPRNRGTISYIARRFKELYPEKNIWMWTGFKLEDIQDEPEVKDLLQFIDVVIDGKYEQDNPPKPGQLWRGSANQRLIDVKTILTD